MSAARCSCHRAGRAAGLSPLLPLLLSAVRAATPPADAPAGARQLLQQVIQSAASSAWSNAAPTRPWQAFQSAPSALAVLESAAPVRPLQVIQSALPVRPLQSLAGRPGVYWLQNSQAVANLQNAAASFGVPGAGGSSGGASPTSDSQEEAEDVAHPAWAESRAPSRRRRRSLASDVEEVPDAEDLLDEAAQQMVAAPASTSGEKAAGRQEKALQYLNMGGGYLAMGPEAAEFSALELDEAGLTLADEDGNELLSRAAPFRNRNQPDSPIYYIRLPPSPYVLVPGVGYVSSPSRRPLGGMSAAAPPPPPPPAAPASSPFYNLPLAFMSNGKPTGVYQPSWSPPQPQRPPRPAVRPPPQQSAMFSLNKGPYVFNGRPSDIFILRDSYDTLYGDALSSFYP